MDSVPSQVSRPPHPQAEQASSSFTSDNTIGQDSVQVQGASETVDNEEHLSLVADLSKQPTSNADSSAVTATASDTTTSKPEPRHCWICLQNEDEEGSNNSAWRSPCPCNLQAHEDCMLDWVADLEAPRSRSGRSTNKILCPQCKAEIRVEAPRDIIVSAMDLLTKTGRSLLLPTGYSALFGCLYSGSLVYGLNSLYLVFGNDYAEALIRQQSEDISIVRRFIGDGVYSVMLKLTEFTDPFMPMSDLLSLEMFIGLPMIAPALILSRTNLADYIFAVLPVSLLAFTIFSSPENRLRRWPPSPGLAITVLPYIRAAYNELYRRTFSDLEKKWDQAVLRNPREGETIEQVALEQNAQNDGGDVIEIEIRADLGGRAEEEEEEQFVEEMVNPELHDGEAAQARQVDAQPDANANAGEEQPNGVPAPQPDANNRQVARPGIYLLDVASSVMGALFFPAVSSLMGDLLKYTLPKTWVTRPFARHLMLSPRAMKELPATGLLQEKWGRSFVGGCLFVVLKDALILYVKWKRARNHGKRKIIDYVPK